jgi:hypothetical protein
MTDGSTRKKYRELPKNRKIRFQADLSVFTSRTAYQIFIFFISFTA